MAQLINGKLPDNMLAAVSGTGVRIYATLVPQTNALRAAFRKAFGKGLTLTDGYRAYSGNYYAQYETFMRRYTTTYLPGRPTKTWNGRTWYLKPGQATAAVPGTSNHGWGQAIDFGAGVNRGNSPEHNWMRANAHRFGWFWPSWAAQLRSYEPWHWESAGRPVPVSDYLPYLEEHGIVVPDLTTPAPLVPTPLEDDDMPVIIRRRTATGSASLITGGHSIQRLGEYSIRALKATYPTIEERVLSEVDYDTMLALHPLAPNSELVDDIVAALPTNAAVTAAEVEAALRNVLGSLND